MENEISINWREYAWSESAVRIMNRTLLITALFAIFLVVPVFPESDADNLFKERKLLLLAEKLLAKPQLTPKAIKTLLALAKFSKRVKHDAKFKVGCQALAIMASFIRDSSDPLFASSPMKNHPANRAKA